jgi:hypothetical protein
MRIFDRGSKCPYFYGHLPIVLKKKKPTFLMLLQLTPLKKYIVNLS